MRPEGTLENDRLNPLITVIKLHRMTDRKRHEFLLEGFCTVVLLLVFNVLRDIRDLRDTTVNAPQPASEGLTLFFRNASLFIGMTPASARTVRFNISAQLRTIRVRLFLVQNFPLRPYQPIF
jgi:hypothetical protein